ncbi:MAG: transposase [bacterium]
MDKINGYFDHVHCLLALNAEMSISKTIQLIKGEASFWANNVKLVRPKLEWADEYFAVSVSESMLEKVRNYIRNQEKHHKKVSFTEEYNQFISKYKFHG